MTTAAIQGLYPYFCSALAALHTDPHGRSLAQLLRVKLDADLVRGGQARYRITITDQANKRPRLDYLGTETTAVVEGWVSARVFDWATRQVPTVDNHHGLPPSQWWCVTLQARPAGAGQYATTLRYGSYDDFATLLRGMLAYERQQDRRAAKLVGQLCVYHLEQLTTAPTLAVAAAAVEAPASTPTYGLAEARQAVGVLLGCGAATVRRVAHRVGMAVGFSGGEELAV
ncbi:hypothetical protein E4631_06160 [Hymenobacter sp. UV11]|uniref:hypothetical protein n=1 Tax=Hymenobacter sp. UV11 TaxID=1849735 RepID=UPI00105B9821|nr:hypothetical protein [Hymenobacter sp. UV11]TDN38262.1 hypothetical protein A8B98_24975 [Hymenobacter sp. UV11]TFZ67561.1 hypothetical protein E4631_06160 [Hymenobacter sp. UV11]